MSGKGIISNISSSYCLKTIVSYIKYETVLKLVKFNKHLQKKLDINIKNYSLDYELKKIKQEDYDTQVKGLPFFFGFEIFLHLYQLCISFSYIYKINQFDKVRTFSIFVFCFQYVMLFSLICGSCIRECENRLWIVCIVDYVVQSICFGISIWILYYFENQNNWIAITLWIFAIFISVFLILPPVLLYNHKCCPRIFWIVFIIKFQGIEINDLEIGNAFIEMDPGEQKRFILKKAEEMTLKNDQNDKNIENILSKIDEYRKENKLNPLKYINKLPQFIIKGNSLDKFTLNNIIEIENKKYLFKYPSGEFLTQLKNKNKNILKHKTKTK